MTALENRIANLVDAPTAPTGSLAERVEHPTPAELGRVWSGAVFAAIAALQAQLSDENPAVARAAANSILDLEKTRLRHGRELAGAAEHRRAAGATEECGTRSASDGVAGIHPVARAPGSNTALPDLPPLDECERMVGALSAEDKITLFDRINQHLDAGDYLPDDEDEEEELAAIPLPEPPPTLAELFRARYAPAGDAPANSHLPPPAVPPIMTSGG